MKQKGTTTLEELIRGAYKEKTCPVCGKIFCLTSLEWVYKKYDSEEHIVYFCSWKCLRKDEAEESKKTRKRIKVDQYDIDGTFIQTHASIDDAAVEVDGIYNGVRCACKSGTVYKGYLWRYNTDGMS